ncbi:MAG TPA: chromate resistance protein ChrB domain-containing protein [Thermoanaerobaculia bacterium]|nr:chromate resistance protein ChrB domain-containing protein [Thermoanaerobaculia bacterium]
MNWVTRKHVHVNRAATAWLVRRFLDPRAEISFVEPEQVEAVQLRDGALGFDAPGARYPHRDERGRCSFEQLVDERLAGDAALQKLARIVHGADFPAEIATTPESAGLWAISQGFTEVASVAGGDAEIVERAAFLYDSLYAHLRRRLAPANEADEEGGR